MRRLLVMVLLIAFVGALLATVLPSSATDQTFSTHIDNPYFPLTPGDVYRYTGGEDRQSALDVMEVTRRTKVIAGVTTREVHDQLYLDGVLAEDTLDWYAQDDEGTVWYFGEDSKELDAQGNVVSTEGSWQAGVDSAEQGIIMLADPRVGASYRQEYYKGVAEDRAKVISLSETVTVPAGTFTNVLETKEWTRLEPGVASNKYYARGVGDVREVDVKGGDEHLELVSVTHS